MKKQTLKLLIHQKNRYYRILKRAEAIADYPLHKIRKIALRANYLSVEVYKLQKS